MPRKPVTKTPETLRRIPSVDLLLQHQDAAPLQSEFGREPLTRAIRTILERTRERLREGAQFDAGDLEPGRFLRDVRAFLEERRAPSLRRVINATGVVLHTGLGRAVLAEGALRAIQTEQKGYSLLEIDGRTGERGIRESFVAELVCEVTGAEAATVVNNNAAATLLCLATLARGREVIVSRGQLVEIGGSFRIPDVMEQSGAKLVEVGTTNKTRLSDYERRINDQTALLLRVHTSNYRIVGFTEAPSLEGLVSLAKKHKLPVMDDIGSGCLIDLSAWGLTDEPTPQASIRAGAAVACFSGDKLLGGPQAGIIIGAKETVGRIRKNPLFRALRVDKLTLTALEATLKLYLDPERLLREIPTLRMLTLPPDELQKRADELATLLRPISTLKIDIRESTSETGGGSIPGQTLPTRVVTIRSSSRSPQALAAALRAHRPCIMGRVQRDALLLDVRTLQTGEAQEIAAALAGM